MIVLLSYFSDGSGKPEVIFFTGDVAEVAMGVASETEKGKVVEIYEISALDSYPQKIYPPIFQG